MAGPAARREDENRQGNALEEGGVIIFDPKEPGASEIFAFDFTAELGGDTLTGTPTIDADGVTAGAPAIDGNLVKVRLSGGTPGTVATVLCSVRTTGGNTLVQLGVVPIGGAAIDLATAKAAQRIEGDSEDALLAGFLRAAIGSVETAHGQEFDGAGRDGRCSPASPAALGIRLMGPQIRIILMTWYGSSRSGCGKARSARSSRSSMTMRNGVEQTLPSFRLVEGSQPNCCRLMAIWPVTAFGPGHGADQLCRGLRPRRAEPPELAQIVDPAVRPLQRQPRGGDRVRARRSGRAAARLFHAARRISHD
jgi:hypothetical protein